MQNIFPNQPVDFFIEAARGRIAGVTTINKFGLAPSGVQTTATDIWGRADATPTQQIWLAPTAARVHAIVSTSASDDGSPAGVGARTVKVYGLTSWSTAETSETVTLDGTTPVNTANSYVIIHRMKVLTSGGTSINVGTISATAATDSTVTAIILPGNGQTEMAIYGIPSIQSAFLLRWSAAVDQSGGATATVDFRLLVNENPDVQTVNFLRKDDMAVQSTGSSNCDRNYGSPPKYAGPCIIKVQAIGSAADIDAKSGFDLLLINN